MDYSKLSIADVDRRFHASEMHPLRPRAQGTMVQVSKERAAWISRLLKRLRLHGLIKKIGRAYKYYLNRIRKQVFTNGLKLRELVIIP